MVALRKDLIMGNRRSGRPEGLAGASPAPHSASRLRVLPIVEAVALALLLLTPLALWNRPELVTLATNVLILSMLAISFDLCWGYSGIMSFGQALFFGVAGYVVALVGRDLDFSPIWGTLPLAMLVGLGLSLLFAAMLLLGRRRRHRSSSHWAR